MEFHVNTYQRIQTSVPLRTLSSLFLAKDIASTLIPFFSNAYKVVIVDLLFGNLLSQSIILLLKAVKEFDQLL